MSSVMSRFNFVLAAFVFGCASTGSSTNHFVMEKDVGDFVSNLRREIPPGTSIVNATALMKARGFECQIRRNSSFLADLPDGSHSMKPETLEGIDFVLCTRVQRIQILGSEVTSVALILSGDTVDDIRIKVTGFGL